MTVNSKGRCKNYHFLVLQCSVKIWWKMDQLVVKVVITQIRSWSCIVQLIARPPPPGYNRQLCLRQNNSMTWWNGMVNKPLLRQKEAIVISYCRYSNPFSTLQNTWEDTVTLQHSAALNSFKFAWGIDINAVNDLEVFIPFLQKFCEEES